MCTGNEVHPVSIRVAAPTAFPIPEMIAQGVNCHMILLEAFLNSNIIQMLATFASGAGLYLLVNKYPWIFDVVGDLLASGIFISFLFNIG